MRPPGIVQYQRLTLSVRFFFRLDKIKTGPGRVQTKANRPRSLSSGRGIDPNVSTTALSRAKQ